MAMTVHLPDELRERLAAEAARRGTSVDALVAEMVAKQLPAEASADAAEDALRSFIGCGSSGNPEPFDLRKARRELADKKLAEGA
jgi:hypothetical protein